jgi:hypothetical protein
LKRLAAVFVVILLFVVVTVAGCGENPKAAPSSFPVQSQFSLNGSMYDDQQSSVYIRVADPVIDGEDKAISEIMAKKAKWELDNPNKHVVAMSVVVGNTNHGVDEHATIVMGLLIHYEEK